MKIKLERDFGYTGVNGDVDSYFGVLFTCKNRKVGKQEVLSEWFTDLPTKEAKEMEAVGRVEILKD